MEVLSHYKVPEFKISDSLTNHIVDRFQKLEYQY